MLMLEWFYKEFGILGIFFNLIRKIERHQAFKTHIFFVIFQSLYDARKCIQFISLQVYKNAIFL